MMDSSSNKLKLFLYNIDFLLSMTWLKKFPEQNIVFVIIINYK